jgi:hypothetical protein
MMFINDPGVEDRADKSLRMLSIYPTNLKYDEDTYRKFFFYLFPPQLVQKTNDDKQLVLF